MSFFKKHAYTILFSSILVGANTYSLLKTFVIPSAVSQVVVAQTNATTSSSDTTTSNDASSGQATVTDSSYQDDNISITITTESNGDTTYYVADIELSSAEYLKTALAKNTFGTNITETTSAIASSNNAIFAVNGDYYGANETGYVIKNGVIYRDTSRSSEYEDLAVYADGSFQTFNEEDTTAQALLDSGVVNTFAFGPTLVSNGEIAVSSSDEVGRAMSDNPRTAIGIIEEEDGSLHYIIIVSDGRTDASTGLTLYEMAEIMQSYGVTTAYNLDGGGSSTMYFNGQIINNPTTNGNTIKERAVSDIVYIGY
ncbi:phosphodiester glycosidase family protein [Streptococcus moroccensis]|uniref:Exopolysaccharide biosynthesis protein n=1 Tax=Streptococcus moroccensis TaxID=1451356 RepID=A0ABT9YNR2_9STRE|nr:phosphodiester glycosidase family protein [Streptococcus moroccensis]MDQ0221620.1 exopolysaccharide biosynthesis protein [Streptococcus moroccensis]